MKRAAVLALALIALAPGVAGAAEPARCGPEDQPGWSWSQCGDGARGVILRSAPADCRWADGFTPECFTVVTACEYRKLRRAGKIDRARTASLRGDGWARDHGCRA